MAPSHPMVGRDRERSVLESFFDAPADLPAAILIRGDAGMGKTTLWRVGLDAARERSYRIMEARPARAESTLAFSALGDLFADVIDEALAPLPDPQRHAIEAALLLRPAEGVVLDQRAIGVAVLGALRAVAAGGSVLVAIDDVQWLDKASATVVGFALRRLRSESVAVLLAQRAGDAGGGRLDPGLETTMLDAGPLSLGATHALIHGRLGVVVPRPALRRLHELSGGNPFYALELARSWADGSLGLGPGEPLPPDLESLLGARLAALPARTRRVLAIAAALSRPTVPALEAVEGVAVGPALRRAAAERVIEPSTDGVRFTHPLLAASAYAGASARERIDIHARLAQVVSDAEEAARHLALATTDPDEAVAAAVERAAEAAFRRGAPSSAADLIGLALRLTPEQNDAGRTRRLMAEAGYRFEAGETRWASEALADLVARASPGPERAGAIARQARVRHFGEDVRGSVELLRQALAEAGDDAKLRVEIEEGLAWGLLLMREDLSAAAEHARSAVRHAERLGDDAAQAETLAALAMTEALLGEDSDGVMSRALALEPATLHLRILRHPSFAHGYLLSAADRLDEARTVFRDLLRRAEEHGDESALAPIFIHLATIEWLAGDWSRAATLAEEAHAFALQSGQLPSQAAALARSALVHAQRGDATATRLAADHSLKLAGGGDFDPAQPSQALARGGEQAIWALGHLSLSLDDHLQADRYLGPLCAALLVAGIAEPGELRPLPDEVEALVGLGRLDAAAEHVRRLEAMADRLGRPSALASAARSRAILRAASGEVDAALEAAERAWAHQQRAGLPFESGRTLLVLGTVQRRIRLKRLARETLEAAVAAFDALGARIWADKVRAELRRIGGRSASTGALTPTERRAAELVADGLSNKEVATALFVSPKTVEANLSRVYAKLGIQSRIELVRWLAHEGEVSEPDGAP